jgi:hypothetical protein
MTAIYQITPLNQKAPDGGVTRHGALRLNQYAKRGVFMRGNSPEIEENTEKS